METKADTRSQAHTGTRAAIAGLGAYVPERRVRNEDLTQFPAAIIPLIQKKTGVEARHYAADGESTSDLAAAAALRCLESAGVQAADVDAIILSTSSPDRIQPPTAARVQALIGASQAAAFDLNAVCAGAVFAIQVADSLIRSETYNTVLVVAAELYSRFLNPRDFSTMPYFGDGAGAMLLKAAAHTGRGVLHTLLRSDGSGWEAIGIRAGGTMLPHACVTNPADAFFSMRGREVYDFAVTRAPQIISELLNATGVPADRITAVVAHQANLNVLEAIADRTGIPFSRFPITLDQYGNTASASVLIGLESARRNGTLRSGDYVILVAFGGGLSWGASLICL